MCDAHASLRVFFKLTLKKLPDVAGAKTAYIAAAAAGATRNALKARLSFVSQVSASALLFVDPCLMGKSQTKDADGHACTEGNSAA